MERALACSRILVFERVSDATRFRFAMPMPISPASNPAPAPDLKERIEKDCLTLCRALGYDLNTVEFAVEGGVPYAIDFMNPAPDAEITSVGQDNFDWIVNAVAEIAVKEAQSDENPAQELRWASFLKGSQWIDIRKPKAPVRRKAAVKP